MARAKAAKQPKDPHADCPAPVWMGTYWQCNNHHPVQIVNKPREPYNPPAKISESNIAAQPHNSTIEDTLRAELGAVKKEREAMGHEVARLRPVQDENARLESELKEALAQLATDQREVGDDRFAMVAEEALGLKSEIERLRGLLEEAGVDWSPETEVPTLSGKGTTKKRGGKR